MENQSEKVRTVLDQIEELGRINDARQQDRSRKVLNLERPTAELISILLRASRRKNVLEIGTSNGFSALWIAWALSEVEGAQPLQTIERDPLKVEQARLHYRSTGMRDGGIQFLEGDATDLASRLAGPFDCVFFDADRLSAPEQLRILLPKLSADVILLCDNVLSHPEEVASYLAAVRALPFFTDVTVPVGKGLHLAYRHGNRLPGGPGLPVPA